MPFLVALPSSCARASPASSSTSRARQLNAALAASADAPGLIRECPKADSAMVAQVRASMAQSPLCRGKPANGPRAAR